MNNFYIRLSAVKSVLFARRGNLTRYAVSGGIGYTGLNKWRDK